MSRYEVRDGSQSGHCCFESTVVDTEEPSMANGEQLDDDDDNPRFDSVCECFNKDDAEKIAVALNQQAHTVSKV